MSTISLPECLAYEIVIGKKKGYVITLYRCPSQNQGEFEHFLLSLEILLGNIRNQDPAFTIILGDFNARPKRWWISTSQTMRVHKLNLSIHCMVFLNLYQNQHTSSKIHYHTLTSFLQINPIL